MNPIETALDELREALTTFVGLLVRENEALQDVHAEELSEVVAEKAHWSQTSNTAWNRLVIASGIDTGRGESLEGALAEQPDLLEKWKTIRKLVEAAEQLNHGNSVLIEAQMRRTRQALDVLQSASNRGSLYGANGLMIESYQSRHTLDKV